MKDEKLLSVIVPAYKVEPIFIAALLLSEARTIGICRLF